LSVRVRIRSGEDKVEVGSVVKLPFGKAVRPADIAGIDKRFSQVAIATGMESLALAHMRHARAEDSIQRTGLAGDEPLLLAWFSVSLSRNQFDDESWQAIGKMSDDRRAIRDAHLYRALSRGKMRLTQTQLDAIKAEVAGNTASRMP